MQEEIIVENGIKSILQKIFDYYYSYKRTCKTVALGELLNIDKVVMPRGTLADCDNATNGIYYINGTITNAPISFGVLISFIDTVKTNYGFQIAMQTWGGVIYVRSRTEVLTSWTSWYKLSATIES